MPKSYEEMVAEAREQVESTGPDEVRQALNSEEKVTILDVREPAEWDEAHIRQAKLIPRGLLEYLSASELPDPSARIVVHCASGGRSVLATKTLEEMGYGNVANMEGGIKAWRERGYEVDEG